MITVVWKFSKQYQNGKGYMLVLIATFILVGIIYQTINPEIKIQRLIGSMSITYIYLYHNGLIYYVDGLTQLLNQRSFLNYTSNLKCISTIIIFDIDDFRGSAIPKRSRRHLRCFYVSSSKDIPYLLTEVFGASIISRQM